MSCPVTTNPGQLPPFWDRNTVFVANLLSLFYGNEGETQRLCDEVGHIDSYGGRLIPIIDLLFRGTDKNLLVLESAPDQDLMHYFVERCGLTVPEHAELTHKDYLHIHRTLMKDGTCTHEACARIKEHPANWMDGFVTDDVLESLSSFTGKKLITTQTGSKRGNNKLALHEFLVEKGHPTFDTHVADTPNDAIKSFRALADQGYQRAVVKSQVGASGIGMIQTETSTTSTGKIPNYLFYEGACLVQGWLDDGFRDTKRLGSPSVQMFIGEDRAWLYDLTEQILSAASVHEGNLAPPPYILRNDTIRETIYEQASDTAVWLHDQGYRGTASADFLILEQKGKPLIILCEVNARVTGATYPAVLARHLRPGDAWLLRNLKFDPAPTVQDVLQSLDKHNYLFTKQSEAGLIPINFNRNDEGRVAKGQFLSLARHTEECIEMILDTHKILPVHWEYDRD